MPTTRTALSSRRSGARVSVVAVTAGIMPNRARGALAAVELGQQVARLGQVGADDLARHLEQLEGARVADAVVDVGRLAPALQDAVAAQHAEVLGGAAGV